MKMFSLAALSSLSISLIPASVFAGEIQTLNPKASTVLRVRNGLPNFSPIETKMELGNSELNSGVDTRFFTMSDDASGTAKTPAARASLYLAIHKMNGIYEVFETGVEASPYDVKSAPHRCRYVRPSTQDKRFALLVVDVIKSKLTQKIQYYLFSVPSEMLHWNSKLFDVCRNSDPVATRYPDAHPFYTQTLEAAETK